MNKDEKKTLNIKKTLDLAIENHQRNIVWFFLEKV